MPEHYEEIAPGTGLIAAIRAERSSFHSWAGEMLDNSLDASASRVALLIAADQLSVSDNGHGIERVNDTAVFKISQHAEMRGTKLGRYGVGLKYKAIQHGDILRIRSVSKDGLMSRKVDWSSIQRSGRWLFPIPKRSAAQGQPLGTVVMIEELTKQPKIADIERTKQEIQRRYYPAIENGVEILLNGELIGPIAIPALTDVVERSRTFPGGRSAHVRGGMLVDPSASKLRQVDLCVAFRVIKPDDDFGCDNYGGIRSMFARVELSGPWILSKFKDDIADDPYEEELEAWVEEVLTPILEKCQGASMLLKTKQLEDLLNDMLPQHVRAVRPEQKQRLGRIGEKRKRGAGTANEAPETKSGPAKKKALPPGILIEFADGLNEEWGYGRVQPGKSSTRIQLSRDNPHIAELMNYRDQRLAAIGLYGFACLLLEGKASEGRLAVDLPLGLRAWNLGEQQSIPTAEAAE